MRLDELDPMERQVLFGVLAHMATADEEITDGEQAEIDALGRELGVPGLTSALAAARVLYPTDQALMAAAATVTRPEARALIRRTALDLSGADGRPPLSEAQFLARLDQVWGRPR